MFLQVEALKGEQAGGCGERGRRVLSFRFSRWEQKEAGQEVRRSQSSGEYDLYLSRVLKLRMDHVGIQKEV